MATKATSKPASTDDTELDEDDIWSELVTENAVPPMKVNGILIPQPTKKQVDAWRVAQTAEDGERALFGDLYEQIHALFKDQPEYVWENFNIRYLKHMFGSADEAQMGK